MAGKGGYQAPQHPAPVSGVGANSRRTDGGPVQKLYRLPAAQGTAPPNQYGEDTSYYQEQQTAPLAAAPQAPPPASAPSPQQAPPAGGGVNPSAVTPIGAPSQRPDEPVTTGAAAGPGAGPAALNLPNPAIQAQQSAAQFIQQMAATSNNPALQYLASTVKSSY